MEYIEQNQQVRSNRVRNLNELVSLPDDALIGVNEAALLMGRSRETVRRWRKMGIGPLHLNHPMGNDYAQYQIGEIRNWIKARQDVKLPQSLNAACKHLKNKTIQTKS